MAVHKTIDGVKLDEETYAAVKKMADRGIGKGRGERQSATVAEMCAALVHTGVFRRIAANKWAKAHPAPKAAKKPAKVKSPKTKKASTKKNVKKGSKKPARASKPKATKKETAPPAGTNPATPAPGAPPVTGGGVLD